MPHDDFISNDLVNMRERLRRNYEERQRNTAPAPDSGEVQEKIAAAASTVSMSLPVLRGNCPDTEIMRECRELEGRLLRDLAASQSIGEMLEKSAEENEKFQTVSSALLEELQQTPAENCTKEQLCSLRAKYMSASGRWNALCTAGNRRETPDFSSRALHPEGRYWWLLAAALLVSALIVSGTLIALWG